MSCPRGRAGSFHWSLQSVGEKLCNLASTRKAQLWARSYKQGRRQKARGLSGKDAVCCIAQYLGEKTCLEQECLGLHPGPRGSVWWTKRWSPQGCLELTDPAAGLLTTASRRGPHAVPINTPNSLARLLHAQAPRLSRG